MELRIAERIRKIAAITRVHFSKFRRMNKWFCELQKELEKLPRRAIVLLNVSTISTFSTILTVSIFLIVSAISNFSIF